MLRALAPVTLPCASAEQTSIVAAPRKQYYPGHCALPRFSPTAQCTHPWFNTLYSPWRTTRAARQQQQQNLSRDDDNDGRSWACELYSFTLWQTWFFQTQRAASRRAPSKTSAEHTSHVHLRFASDDARMHQSAILAQGLFCWSNSKVNCHLLCFVIRGVDGSFARAVKLELVTESRKRAWQLHAERCARSQETCSAFSRPAQWPVCPMST